MSSANSFDHRYRDEFQQGSDQYGGEQYGVNHSGGSNSNRMNNNKRLFLASVSRKRSEQDALLLQNRI